MKKSFDLKVVETLEQMVNVINESKLPYTIVKYMLSDLFNNVQNNLNANIAKEKEAILKEEGTQKTE